MRYVGIEITRFWPNNNEFRFKANDGIKHRSILINLRSCDWTGIGMALISFSESSRCEYHFMIKSHRHTMPYLNHRPWFVIRAIRTTGTEHNTALQITMNFEKIYTFRSMGERCSLILAEPSAINRLGKLLVEYSQPKYRLLKWSVKGDVNEVKEPAPGAVPEPEPPKNDSGREPWENVWSP